MGFSIWWDRKIPVGQAFDQIIETAMERSSCVVVLWSKQSIGSRWVRAEAEAAAENKVLIPALIDDIQIPLAFRTLETANLVAWDGSVEYEAFHKMLLALKRIVATQTNVDDDPVISERLDEDDVCRVALMALSKETLSLLGSLNSHHYDHVDRDDGWVSEASEKAVSETVAAKIYDLRKRKFTDIGTRVRQKGISYFISNKSMSGKT